MHTTSCYMAQLNMYIISVSSMTMYLNHTSFIIFVNNILLIHLKGIMMGGETSFVFLGDIFLNT